MAKVETIPLLCTILIISTTTPAVVQGITEGPEAVKKWFQTLPGRAQKTTNLDFYFHDLLSGNSPTGIPILLPSAGNKAAFGSTTEIDDLLTVGPDRASAEVGRAQGTYSISSLGVVPVLHMSMTFVFTSGEYSGSTLSLLGRNPVTQEYREMPVVGGSGVFRLAQGIATAKTIKFNATSGDATVHYGASVLHYSDGADDRVTSGQVAATTPTQLCLSIIMLFLIFIGK